VASNRIMVTGCRGMLGRDLMEFFASENETVGVDLADFDITDHDATLAAISDVKPRTVLHAAAYTDVDGCEANSELAMKVNAQGTGNVALACRKTRARMILFSTDYVFDGAKGAPYTEADAVNPETVYGRSKLEAEHTIAVLLNDYAILRIAWLYGRHGQNFVKTMLRLGKTQREGPSASKPVRVVRDQIGNPTWTMEVARQTQAVLDRKLIGLYHAGAGGECSWYEFARRIFEATGGSVAVEACTTDQFPRPAQRPKMSALENRRLRQAECDLMRGWDVAFDDFMTQYGEVLTDEL